MPDATASSRPTHGGHTIKMLVPEDEAIPQGSAHLRFAPERTQIYENGWMVT